MTTTINDLGEIELLNRLKKFMRQGQIDDDVAEIDTLNKVLLINNDLLVENIHFSDEISNARDIGWKSITTAHGTAYGFRPAWQPLLLK